MTGLAWAPPPPLALQVIAREVIDYLRDCSDEVARGEAVAQLADLAERYAPDHQWFVDTINQLFEVAGEPPLNLVHRQLARSSGGWGRVHYKS